MIELIRYYRGEIVVAWIIQKERKITVQPRNSETGEESERKREKENNCKYSSLCNSF